MKVRKINEFCFVELPTDSKIFQRVPTCVVYIDHHRPSRPASIGPLIKSYGDTLPTDTQDDLSEGKIGVLEE